MEIRGAGDGARQIKVPEDLRALASLPRIDYEDAFRIVVPGAGRLTARRWAEEVLEGAPEDLRGSVLAGWTALGFELGQIPAAGFVLGWRLRRSDPDIAILASAAPVGVDAELVFRLEPDALVYGTFVGLGGEAARGAWAGIEPFHPGIVGDLLDRAAERVRAGPPGG